MFLHRTTFSIILRDQSCQPVQQLSIGKDVLTQKICLVTSTSLNVQHRYRPIISIIHLVHNQKFASLTPDIYLVSVLHNTYSIFGYIVMGSWKGRGNQFIQMVKVLYCKLPTNGKQQPAFPLEVGLGFELRSHRWEGSVLPLCHSGPLLNTNNVVLSIIGLYV